MRASLRNNPMAPQVEIKSPEDLASMRLFRTDAGSGFAIKSDNDIVALFASPDEPAGGAYAMLQAAVEAGGRKLDAFNTYLPRIYEAAGFRPVAKLKWNDEYAPPGWDKKVFEDYQNGEPDVVFFAYDPDYMGSGGVRDIPYVNDYDEAVALQNAEVRRVADRVEQVHGRAPEVTPAVAPEVADAQARLFELKQQQPVQTVNDLFALAPRAQTQLMNALKSATANYNVQLKNPGIKTRATTEEKFTRKGYKSANEFTDVSRAGMVVNSVADADAIIADLGQRLNILDEGWSMTPSGFVDRKVLVQTPSGMISEVQIWLPSMYDAKFTKGGQDLYTKWRSETDQAVKRDLEKQMQAIYSDATKADTELDQAFAAVAGTLKSPN